MRQFILAAVLGAVYATEQAVFDGSPVPSDAMWTDEQIKNWVAEHHGGHEWQAFEGKELLTEASRTAFTTTVITNLVEEWQTSFKYLPNVCDPGIACRAEIEKQLVIDLEEKWKKMLVSIDTKLKQTKITVGEGLVSFYTEAYECDPGCTCDNIMTEYDQIIKWQEDLSSRIVEYTENLDGLIVNETTIIASCPAYIYDSDGYAYFDYSGAVTSETITETTSEILGGDESTWSPVETTTSEIVGGDESSWAPDSSSESSTEVSSSASYSVNGETLNQAEYDAYMAYMASMGSSE